MEKLLFFEIVQFLMGATFGYDHICYKQKIYYLDRGDHMNELHQIFQDYLNQKQPTS